MISILIDKKLDGLTKEISYSVCFLFETLGYNYKFISSLKQLGKNDILFCYSLLEPSREEIAYLAEDRILFFAKAETFLYRKKTISKEKLAEFIREKAYHITVPFLSENNFNHPVVSHSTDECYWGQFKFDIIGHIFFYLTNSDFSFIQKKDKHQRIQDNESYFTKFSNNPFLNYFLWLTESFIKEAIDKRDQFLIKKEYWPRGENFASAITHNVDKLQKWSIGRFISSVLSDFINLLTFKWKILGKNFIDKFKYILTNFEPYWNFSTIFDIEKKFNIKSTYFFGISDEAEFDVDYEINKRDVKEVIKDLIAGGHEVSLYASYNSYKKEIIGRELRKIINIIGDEEIGVRQNLYRYDDEITPELHEKTQILYDSSISFFSRNGFKNGMAFPYKQFDSNPINKIQYRFNQLPNTFSSEYLRLNKQDNISYDKAVLIVKELIKSVEKINGLLVFEFNVANFVDIPYCKNLFSYLLDLLKQRNCFIAPLKTISRWWDQRYRVRLEENDNTIKVYFPEKLDLFTLSIFGNVKVKSVVGANYKIINKQLKLRDISANSTIIIDLINTNQPAKNDENNDSEETV